MTAIFGIIYLDGQPVDLSTLQTMQAALQYWGPDGAGLWQNGPVGLGHLLLYNTPESLYETLPLRSPSGDMVLTARARLDNRAELCDALDVPPPERATTPDGSLILKAYEKWGEACPQHLLGDWVFAVWDARQRRIFIARDHHGNTGLYYYHSPRLFAFASCLKGLLALPMIPQRLNALRVIQVLTSWSEQGAPTAYEGIMRLPPAHALTVTADTLTVRQYWRLEDAPDIRYASDDDYVDAFLSLYREAVRCRLRSHRPVGATLSGGLDSGSVCALAARELVQTDRRLPAFSSVPLADTRACVPESRFGDETPFIEATSQFAGTIDVHYIRAEEVTPLHGIRRALWLHDEPGHAAGNQFWLMALLAAAQQHGIGTLLTGQGGNATVSWFGLPSTADPLSLFHQKRYRQALRSLVRALLPAVVVRWYRQLSADTDPWQSYSAMNPALARQMNLTQLMCSYGHDPTFSPPADARAARYRIIRPGQSIVGALWQESGAGYGLEVRDPTYDKRLMEFCFGIPDTQYRRNGHSRWLIRRALTGILPSEVLWNARRGLQAADIGQRILDSQAEIEGALTQLDHSALARYYLDLPLMWKVFHSLQTRVDRQTTTESGTILLRGLMAGLFLLRFDKESRPSLESGV